MVRLRAFAGVARRPLTPYSIPVCLSYNTITRVVDEVPVEEPGTYFTGVDHGFLCFPKLVQTIEFAGDGGANGPALHTRTREGLDIELDMSIEYRLIPGELKQLFDKVNMDYLPFYEQLAASSLRNTVSKNPAENFLNNQRANVSTQMQLDLNERLNPFHATVITVNMRSVNLPDEFEFAIQAVESVRLEQRQAETERGLELEREALEREKAVIDLEAEGRRMEIDAEAAVTRARLEREGLLTSARTQADKALIQAQKERQTILIAAENDRLTALTQRVGVLQNRQNEQDEAIIGFETEKNLAVAAARVAEITANATAAARVRQAEADAEGLAEIKAAEQQRFQDLKDSADMSSEEMLRYVWLDNLKNLDGTKMFIDYKKGASAPPRGCASMCLHRLRLTCPRPFASPDVHGEHIRVVNRQYTNIASLSGGSSGYVEVRVNGCHTTEARALGALEPARGSACRSAVGGRRIAWDWPNRITGSSIDSNGPRHLHPCSTSWGHPTCVSALGSALAMGVSSGSQRPSSSKPGLNFGTSRTSAAGPRGPAQPAQPARRGAQLCTSRPCWLSHRAPYKFVVGGSRGIGPDSLIGTCD